MSYILLHKANLHNNLDLISKKAGGIEKIFAVLKDNAYGHGLDIFAKEVSNFGVIRAVVRNLNEALCIQNIFKEVLVLSEKPENLKPIQNIIFAINSIEAFNFIPKNTNIAIKVDTGMHRNGLHVSQLKLACKKIVKNSLNLHSIFTHFRASDELGSEYFWQKKNFEEVKQIFQSLKNKYSLKNTYFHSANSAALLRCNKLEDDFARVGIAMYGYDTLPNSFNKRNFLPVLELFAEKISQRVLKKGEKVGYGGKYIAKNNDVVSFYDIGYADGILRFSGNGELKTTNNSLIVGKTSMDGMSIKSCDNNISIFNDVTTWASFFNTIPYELLVKLSKDIRRKFV